MSELDMDYEVEGEAANKGSHRTTEEFKVQADQLVKAIKDLFHEGKIRRVTVLRNDRVLLDVPVIAGVAAGVVLATQLPLLSAIAAAAALAGGCTVRVEREEPPE